MINNIYSKFLLRFILLFFCSFIILEILIRVVDENCYSFFPVYLENEIEKLPKNKNFCAKYTGHPKAFYSTDDYGLRVKNNKIKNNQNVYLLIGDSQAMGYGINFDDHFLHKYLSSNKNAHLEILASPTFRLKSLNNFKKVNDDFNFQKYEKIFFFLNLWVDIDRFVLSWDENWIIKNKKFDIEISKYFRSYEYIKKIVNFSQKRKGQPYNLYFNFLTDDEIEYLIYAIVDQYKLFIDTNSIKQYQFIILPPAWYFDKNQLKKFNYGLENKEFLSLFNDYDYYYNKMQNNLEIISKKLKEDGIDYFLIDHFDNPERSFLKTDYHLNEIGHDEVFKKF